MDGLGGLKDPLKVRIAELPEDRAELIEERRPVGLLLRDRQWPLALGRDVRRGKQKESRKARAQG